LSFPEWRAQRKLGGVYDSYYSAYLADFDASFLAECENIILNQAVHNRPELFRQLRSYRILSVRTYWRLLRAMWLSQRTLWEHIRHYKDFFQSRIGSRSEMMDAEERETLANLPNLITVYRGVRGYKADGLSWTIDYDIAKKYANRARTDDRTAYGRTVFTGTIQKCDVVAFINARNESEIIAQAAAVSVVNRECLGKKIYK
jgi:hypothetical protein